MNRFVSIVEHAAIVLETAGVAVILVGTLAATATFLRSVLQKKDFSCAYSAYRGALGRSILLGLEFLVGADIIGTVAVKPNINSVAVLGLIVLVRTFLSFSLEVEIEGRWPWRKGDGHRA